MGRQIIPLLQRAVEVARRHLRYGRDLDALDILANLVRMGNLPPALAEETHILLAEIHLRRQNYAQARRHLHVALNYQPENAHYHFLMATALEADPTADRRRALYYFRRAAHLDPDNAEFFATWGAYLITLGRLRAGIHKLERAVALAPDEAQYVQQLALAWAALRDFDQARRVTLQALFRNPDDPRLRRLWDEVRWHEARQQQASSREQPWVVPFPASPAASAAPAAEATLVRRDPPATEAGAPHRAAPRPQENR